MIESMGFDGSAVAALEKFATALEVEVMVLEMGQQFSYSSDQTMQAATMPLRQYMSGPIIEDGFDHRNRVSFLSVLEKNSPSAYDFYQANRLRFNNLYSLGFVSADFYAGLEKFPELFKLWKTMLSGIPKTSPDYDNLSLAKKIRLVKAVSAVIEKVLDVL